jgi:hypothetical protein
MRLFHAGLIDSYVSFFSVDEAERTMPTASPTVITIAPGAPEIESSSTPSTTSPAPDSSAIEIRWLQGALAQCLGFPACVSCGFAVFVYLLIPHSIADPDIWWHLRNVEWQIHAHALLSRDVYSWSAAGVPWMNHEWLAEIPFFLGWKMLGPAGLFAVTVVAIEAIFWGVFLLAYRKSQSPMASLAVSAIAAMLSTVSFGPRTLLFGWMCLVAELHILDRFRGRETIGLLLPALFAVWVNTHGSWLIGMAVLAIYVLGGWPEIDCGAICNHRWMPHQRTKLLVVSLLSVAALFANPYGWKLVCYPFDLAFRQKLNIASIEEWRALDFHSPRGRILFATLAVLFLMQLLRHRSWTFTDLGFFILGIYSAVVYSRFLFLAALLSLPLMAQSIVGAQRTATKNNKPWANAVLLLLLIPLVVHHLPTRAQLEHSGEQQFPIRAKAYLCGFQPRGNVFNDFLWGGFLIWNAHQVPVMIDSRVDIFEYRGVFRDYLDAMQLKNTFSVLDKYNIRYVIFSRETPLVYLLQHSPGWKTDYEDATTTILERYDPQRSGVTRDATR